MALVIPQQNYLTGITSQPVAQTGTSPEAPGATPINGVTVRCLSDTTEDAEFAGRLTVEAFRGKYAHNITEQKLPVAVRHTTAQHRGQYESFYMRTFVAELEGRRAGLLVLKFHGDKERRYVCFAKNMEESPKRGKCYLDHICVDEYARGKGVGKVLMERAEYEARARRCQFIYLYVMTDNRAKNLYERQGYQVTMTTTGCGTLGCCLGPPGEAHLMEKGLV